MGKNYYLHLDKKGDEDISQAFDPVHIGKSSVGWYFSLHIYPHREIHDLDDWERLFNKDIVTIRDEYGNKTLPGDMMNIITVRCFGGKHTESNLEVAEVGINNLLRYRIDGDRCIGHGTGTWDLFVSDFS
ncbi:hypothetical protein SAMN05216326_12555 [Nitrosomonas marina]|uniref:Uncharacterized protein n=1 Tax=Nitrosomonas marina TaxID=917 RepID=A0A1I0E7Y3_9PROT|nr:hypothetical protein [Nitrosomonas marina]SET41180.1 hypothetical protein SAMN05216326_12555 [Nitrosomonas marina]